MRFAIQLDGESLNSPSSASNGKFILKFSKSRPRRTRFSTPRTRRANGSRSPVTAASSRRPRARNGRWRRTVGEAEARVVPRDDAGVLARREPRRVVVPIEVERSRRRQRRSFVRKEPAERRVQALVDRLQSDGRDQAKEGGTKRDAGATATASTTCCAQTIRTLSFVEGHATPNPARSGIGDFQFINRLSEGFGTDGPVAGRAPSGGRAGLGPAVRAGRGADVVPLDRRREPRLHRVERDARALAERARLRRPRAGARSSSTTRTARRTSQQAAGGGGAAAPKASNYTDVIGEIVTLDDFYAAAASSAESDRLFVLKFYSKSCRACLRIAAKYRRLATENAGKIDCYEAELNARARALPRARAGDAVDPDLPRHALRPEPHAPRELALQAVGLRQGPAEDPRRARRRRAEARPPADALPDPARSRAGSRGTGGCARTTTSTTATASSSTTRTSSIERRPSALCGF